MTDNALLEFVVWHTENDPGAQRILKTIATRVEEEYSEASVDVVVSVSYQNWGDLAQKLLQQRSDPPDVTHLQPFMVFQVLQDLDRESKFRLHELDALIVRLEKQNGPISTAVRDLHRYPINGGREATFGLAYAVGTTFIAYRRDFMPVGTPLPSSWAELIDFADTLAANANKKSDRPVYPFALPGSSRFFIDQLFNEIVVSLGGSIYDNDGRPALDSPETREALSLMHQMISRTGDAYYNTSYLRQFDLYKEGRVAVVPVTYGRATAVIDAFLTKNGEVGANHAYSVLNQPGVGRQDVGVATIDAEPWVIIERGSNDPQHDLRVEIAERFLELFYQRDTYTAFCGVVPVHLRPIFPSVAERYDAMPAQVRWADWVLAGKRMLEEPGRTAPILMDPGGGKSRFVDFALDLSRQNVIADMVNDSYRSRSGSEQANDEAIDRAVSRATRLDRKH